MTESGDALSNPHRMLFAGRYAVQEIVGRGGAADVVRAQDVRLGRTVAIKIFRRDRQDLPDPRRIEAETHTLASLSHPGLVTLFDAGTAVDAQGFEAPYLVMEFVDGPNLNELRSGAPLPLHDVARLGCEVATALAYIHSAGVVHRDVKPANILVTSPGRYTGRSYKLADFGIARVIDAARLTEHGTAVGTAHYLSPEQATGGTTGPPADVYSLGLVMIECISGRMVFEGSAIAAAVARLHREPEIPAGMDPAWAGLLSEMTARRPEDRPTANVVAERIRALTEQAVRTAPQGQHETNAFPVIAETPATEPITAARQPRRRVGWLSATVATTVAASIAVAVLWSSWSTQQSPTDLPEAGTSSVAPAPPSTITPEPVEPPAPTTADAVQSEPSAVAPATVNPPAPQATTNGTSGNGNNGRGNNGNGNGNNGNGNSNGNGNGNGNGGNGRGN